MSDERDAIKQFERLFGDKPASESEATRLIRDMERTFAAEITVKLNKQFALDLSAALNYATYLLGTCGESSLLWQMQGVLDKALDGGK